MTKAVIVSVARTPIGKAGRGAFNITHGVTMSGHAAKHAVDRAGIDPALIEDSIWGCGYPEYVTGRNVARQAVIRAGLPVSIAGTTVNRFCASGLQAIAMGGHMIDREGARAVLVGGVESISLVQPPARPEHDDWIKENKPELYLTMIETADIVAERYGVSREAQDALAVQSQARTAAAQEAGRFDQEIAPIEVTKAVKDKATGEVSHETLTFAQDECNRPGTQLENLQKLEPVRGAGHYVTAGNASQLSDGAAALVVAGLGVVWIVGPDAPGWWFLDESWWLVGGAATGITQVASAAIALGLIVDPTAAVITQEALDNKRPVKDVYAMGLLLIASMFIGTLLSQVLLEPARWVIQTGAQILAQIL